MNGFRKGALSAPRCSKLMENDKHKAFLKEKAGAEGTRLNIADIQHRTHLPAVSCE